MGVRASAEPLPPKGGEPAASLPGKAKVMAASIGRIVHYVLAVGPSAGQHRAATVVNVVEREPGVLSVSLQVMSDNGPDGRSGDWLPQLFFVRDAGFSEKSEPGTWHWPERD